MTASFVTNTNWQPIAGETNLSYFSQAVGLAVQNFLSPAVGIAVAFALLRGLASSDGGKLGNFFVDVVRAVLYVLLPLSLVLAGNLAQLKVQATGAVGLSTSGALFAVLLLVIIVLIGALSLLPAFALGPLAEQFMGAF